MFESGVTITGGKRRSDINATYASRDGAITPSRSVVAARESLSGVFRGSLEACSQVSGRSDILAAAHPRLQSRCSSHVDPRLDTTHVLIFRFSYS